MLKAEILVKQVVIVIVYQGGAYSRNLDIFAIDHLGAASSCGSIADPNGGVNPEVICNKPALSIKIQAPSLSLASVGILSDCDCSQSTFN